MAECLVYQTVHRSAISRQSIQRIAVSVLVHLEQGESSLSIHLIGEQRMRRLNFLHRGKDQSTDVLSFSTEEDISRERGTQDLGDIFLCPTVIQKQAKRFGVSFQEEFARMLIHGLLHTLGFDHDTTRHAKKMFTLQEDILESL